MRHKIELERRESKKVHTPLHNACTGSCFQTSIKKVNNDISAGKSDMQNAKGKSKYAK